MEMNDLSTWSEIEEVTVVTMNLYTPEAGREREGGREGRTEEGREGGREGGRGGERERERNTRCMYVLFNILVCFYVFTDFVVVM